MVVFLTTLHVIVCAVLIVVVLLQHGKGADMGAVLGGGGGNTVFGSRGAGNFLTKLTTGCAVLFMVTSLVLSYVATEDSDAVLFEADYVEEEAGGTSPGTSTDALEEAGGLEEVPTADDLEEIDPEALEEIPESQ